MQICFSLDFPGRYTYRGARHDVPVRAISVLDAWEPHAPSDPIDRDRPSHYVVMYVNPATFRTNVDVPSSAPVEAPVHKGDEIVDRFRRLYRALARKDFTLTQDERYRELAAALLGRVASPRAASPATRALLRARDFIAAHPSARLGLEEIAAVADLTPWHFARAFRRQFGIPPHRFQLFLRVDLARRLLADGLSGAEVAHRAGFADQSHFNRWFKRVTGTTPVRRRRTAFSRSEQQVE
jgi:AraC-like DNA-binding protein